MQDSQEKDNNKLDNQIQIGNQNNNNDLINKLTKENFEKSIQTNKPLLFEFSSKRSSADRIMLPRLRKLTKKYYDTINMLGLLLSYHTT